MLHQIGLFLHIIAIFLVGGGSISTIVAEGQLWKKVQHRPQEALAFLPVINLTPAFIKTGIIFFIMSGLIMLYSVNWIFLSQPWFIVKLILFVLLPVRGAVIGARTMTRVTRIIQGSLDRQNLHLPELLKLKAKMKRFHAVQFILVGIIIFLVIFKV